MKKGFRWSLASLGLLMVMAHATTPDRATTRTYNTQGWLATVDGPRTDVNDVTSYTYDAQGRIATVTDPLGHVTSYDTYDMYGNPGRSTDPNGVVSVMTYTPEGWPLTITRDSTGTPSTTTLTYDAIGNVTQSKDADGVTTIYTYDDAGRVTDITDAVGNHIHYTLDVAGNRLKEETFDSANTLKRTVSRTYNALSQLLTVVDAFNRTILSYNYSDGYDAAGNPIHSADAAGVQRKRGYDALHRLVSTIDNYNGTDTATKDTQSVSSYDASDHLEGFSDPDGLNTVYSYNGLDDLKSVQSPDTGLTSYVYDAAGNVSQRTDAKGVTSTNTYDALNRRTATTYSDTSLNVAYFYDEPNSTTGCTSSYPIGKLTRVVENAVTTTYCYDARGNVVQKRQTQDAQTDAIGYTYSLAGRLTSTLTPSGTAVQYSRDAAGRISSVTVVPPGVTGAGAGNVVTNITYLPFGPVSSYTFGNGQTVTRTYDINYAVTDIVSPILSLHFAHDAMGNITALGNSAGASPATETYSYDPLYRLTSISGPSGTTIETYTYSKMGDRLSKTGSGLATGIYGYQANTHWLATIGNAARTYDTNGNTTGIASGGETYGYGYNGRNRLTVLQRNGQTIATYKYNADGQRIAKNSTFPQPISQRFAYDDEGRLLGEYGSASKDYVWLNDIPLAVVDSNGSTSALNFIHADGVNTPRAIVDSNGTTIWQWSYLSNAFGEQQPTSSNGYTFNLRFPGQYYDVESGTVYNGFRNYDPARGGYLQADPLGLRSGSNGYAYVDNSPLMGVDPQGLQTMPQYVYNTDWRSSESRAIGKELGLSMVPGYGLYSCSVNGCGVGGWTLGVAGTIPIIGVGSKVFRLIRAGRAVCEVAGEASGIANAGGEAFSGIGATGRVGEEALRSFGGQSQVYFLTSRGARYVDQLANGVAYESKVGYVSMSSRVASQVAKDSELLMSQSVNSVEWHFFTSPVTGRIGAAQSVLDMLSEAGIGVVMH